MSAAMTTDDSAETSNMVERHYSAQTPNVSAVNDLNDNDQFVDDGGYQEVRELFSFLHPTVLDILCVCCATVALICVVLLLWCWVRRRRQKRNSDLFFDDSMESKIIKSVPSSRMASPKLSKCQSCPHALSDSNKVRRVLGSSMTSDSAPRLAPAELTQAGDSYGKNGAYFSGKAGRAAHFTHNMCHDKSLLKEEEPHFSEASCACLWFSLVYDGSEELLRVNLIKADNLPGRNKDSYARDPFVKIFLMPDEKICQVSEVKKNTLSPVFNEIHTFKVATDDVRKHMLRFSVYDVDKRHVRHCLGHVVISLKNVDLTTGQITGNKLEPTIKNATSIGELEFSLIYKPSSEKIKITIYNAKNVKYMEDHLPVGVYVRAQLYYGHKCHSVKHTLVHQGEAEVTFNESLTFTASEKLLDTCNLRISVMLTSYKLNTINEIEYGRVVVGTFMFAHGDELAHWEEMLSRPDKASTHWHSLTSTTNSL